jgi:hypothetical protein
MAAFYGVRKEEEVQPAVPEVNKPVVAAVKEINASFNVLHFIILAQSTVIVVLICMLL